MKDTIVILTGGGPAPGINTVVGSIAKTFLHKGYRVLGLHGGYKPLFSETQQVTEFDFTLSEEIYNKGGSYLRMSRYRPSNEDFENNFALDFFVDNNVKLLVTIGGDDTASTANRVAKFLAKHQHAISNIHVPKTIDNDLPLPEDCPTFGFHSAKDKGSEIATIIYSDAKSSGSWFVICAMGRSAGHLALGIGCAAHYPMTIIPEMFHKTTITVDKIVNLVISAMLKRKLMGWDYGATMISEGVFHELSEEEITKTGIVFSYDDHGHPELGKVSKAQVFNQMIENRVNQLGLKIKSRPVEIGYEVRCADPVGFDLVYCTLMGTGVYELFIQGKTGCIVYVDPKGDICHLYLSDVQDPKTGKIPPRVVNINGDKLNMFVKHIFNYIEPEDYQAARKYVDNPEEFDFKKILNY